MKRVNTVSWSDVEVLTKMMNELQLQLVKWQKFSCEWDGNGFCSISQNNASDSPVIVASINLRDRLLPLIEKSLSKNA